ncbi:MAG: hypothetical protein LF885_06010 [Rickettsia endosymbiont of Culicoides impunctatus]|nr:MAG: hypothetical protein LF885_06010 [Rickettsia endosymbiont of Culicoides impunctatus]
MKLSIWIEVNNLTTGKVTKLFKVSPAHIYKYLYRKNHPKTQSDGKNFLATHGVVTPNDFYGISTELLEKNY